jgi:hypothetical protein
LGVVATGFDALVAEDALLVVPDVQAVLDLDRFLDPLDGMVLGAVAVSLLSQDVQL